MVSTTPQNNVSPHVHDMKVPTRVLNGILGIKLTMFNTENIQVRVPRSSAGQCGLIKLENDENAVHRAVFDLICSAWISKAIAGLILDFHVR